MDPKKPATFNSLASKFSIFTAILLSWVVLVMALWDIREHTFTLAKGATLLAVVVLTAGLISRFTIRVLARPLTLLQEGITAVRPGKFETIQVSSTNDEIQSLGESFNRMILELAASHQEIRTHQDLLEERIRQRTQDLQKATRTAVAASQAKSEFLANISHELRTPMNGLLGMLDVVLDSSLDSEQKEQLEVAQRSAYSLLALLNDILDLSKIEACKMMIETIPYDLQTVLEDCVMSFQARAHQKKITLRFAVDPSTPRKVVGDPLRVRQIAANLLSNAVKFTDRGGVTLSVNAAVAAEGKVHVKIEVRDTGMGIEASKLLAIFEKFTQVDGSITRRYGGTGLGLAITRHLVEMQQGSVAVESTVGEGSAFTVLLPCEVVAPAEAQPADPAPEAACLAQQPAVAMRLLLVEDNIINQKVVLAILRKKGYQIDVANDGVEALARIQTGGAGYDAVLMDVQMPVMDGLEATRVIRGNPQWAHLPIIAMTAHAMNGDQERCMQAGMNAYISKPVQPAHLIATIERYLAVRA